jgi:hypothetical protein
VVREVREVKRMMAARKPALATRAVERWWV